MGPQIETERIFSLVNILMNLKICRLQIGNVYKLIFTSKNWSNDPKVSCSSPSNCMMELVESPLNEISFCTCNF